MNLNDTALQPPTSSAGLTPPFVSAPLRMVRRNQMNRHQILTQIYHVVQADVSLELVPASVYELSSDLGITPEETEAVIFYACAKGYLAMTSPAQAPGEKIQLGPVYLTVAGVDYIENLFTQTAPNS